MELDYYWSNIGIIISIVTYLFGVLGNILGIIVAIAVIFYMVFKRPKNHSKLKWHLA